MKPALHIVTADELPASPWLTLPPAVRTLAAQIADEAGHLRALERLPTAATVERARRSVKRLAGLVAALEKVL